VNDTDGTDRRDTSRKGPLDGLVVTDFSTVLAGPYCAMLLGDLGADVIKVEPPDGDPTRLYGPPYAGPADPDTGYLGESGYYLSINRNKRGMRLDARSPSGRDVLERLIARSDALIENLRPAAFERLGFGEAKLEKLNPRLVHLAITGFGVAGPDKDKPGFDFIIQALSGLMSITGQADEDGGRSTKVGVAISDLTTGMLGAVAVLAALRARDRDGADGRGQRIDISLLGGSIAWLINQAANYLVGGEVPGRMGNLHPNITPYETFRTRDGEIAVAVGSERQWKRFCAALDLPSLVADPRFETNAHRVRHRDALTPILRAAFEGRDSGAWVGILTAAEVPVGQVRDMEEVFADPQVHELGMLASVEHPTIGELKQTGIPWQMSAGSGGAIERPPPLLGEHTDEVLGELGFDMEEIAAFRREGVV
jgi:crotonobetainyl-CoA:carnitine CoA-transferase CaiB-like acyl-CoA transferase